MEKREKITIILFASSIALDLFFYVCFFGGIALGINSIELGFTMLSIAFRYGAAICITSFLLKFAVLYLTFRKKSSLTKKLFFITCQSAIFLAFLGGLAWFIYYLGKVMTSVG